MAKARHPTKRIAIDGKTWRVKIQRPPTRDVNDGLCEPNDRTVYIHPAAIADCGIETVCHELMHARFYDIEEKAVEEFGRLVAEVVNWVARQNRGVIS
jgi:hypothetical protein